MPRLSDLRYIDEPRRPRAIVPAWTRTLWTMLAAIDDEGPHGLPAAEVKQRCSRCDTYARVDLRALARAHGAQLSLWTHRPPCPACGEPTLFLFSPGPSTPMRPMTGAPG